MELDMDFRSQGFLIPVLIVLCGLAWAATVYQAGSMGVGLTTCSMTMGRPFSLSQALLYVALWGVMMAAMMLPSVAPMVMFFSTISRNKRQQGSSFAPAWIFVAGYITLWALTGGVAYGADMAIQSLPQSWPTLKTYGYAVAGVTLVVAGLYQLTPLKYLCLTQCRSPMGFLLNSWREGYSGAFYMGLHHGAYCLGCCWSLMMVLFVVGTMNLVWMGLLTLVIFVEKAVPQGVWIGRGVGIGLVGAGLLLAFYPPAWTGALGS